VETLADVLNVFHIKISGLSVTISLFLVFLGLLYWYSVYPYSVLSRCGIKHPKPVPFLGNIFMFHQVRFHWFFNPINELIKTHGRVCGYYLGRRPVVVIADPVMLRQVIVRDFSSFTNRMTLRFASKPKTDCLLMLRNERWKRVRSILTPSFSAFPCLVYFLYMVPLINTVTDSLMSNLNVSAESGETFDIHKCFGCFTMDVIASVAFGTQVDSQKSPDDPFVRHAQMFFSFSFFRPIMLFFIAFPFITAPLARFLPNKRRDQMNHFFINTIQKIIKQREEQPAEERRRDFLQLMLDSRLSKECVSLEHFDSAAHAADQETHPSEPSSRRPQKKMIPEDEIVGQAFVFPLTGYETSSNTLLPAGRQRKVQREVEFFARHESPDYTNVQELKYLDMVISETLRLYPPGFRFARDIDQDCVLNGQFLPKGATLEIPADEAKASHHPFVYLPFGPGPRTCVGMRLAQLEVKLALVRLFHRFSVVACSETKVPLELKSSSTLGPKNGIFVKIQRRNLQRRRSEFPTRRLETNAHRPLNRHEAFCRSTSMRRE
uniref:Thromboxane-A synthase n=1 Tax=Gasterosteus aculeatus aculeatus TaxID=481459 RepID=A0AAQ4NRD9_GASAC